MRADNLRVLLFTLLMLALAWCGRDGTLASVPVWLLRCTLQCDREKKEANCRTGE